MGKWDSMGTMRLLRLEEVMGNGDLSVRWLQSLRSEMSKKTKSSSRMIKGVYLETSGREGIRVAYTFKEGMGKSCGLDRRLVGKMLDEIKSTFFFFFSCYAKRRRIKYICNQSNMLSNPLYNPQLPPPTISCNPHSPASLHTSRTRHSISY